VIRNLKIKNLILIESCEIVFEQGLTVITGETGAGKTALVQALALIMGRRADAQLVRKDASKAYVEAQFDFDPSLSSLLSEHAISIEPEEYLIISREISKEGKSKAWINSHAVSLAFLQRVASQLIDIVDQHSHQKLRSQEFSRTVVDLFGDTQEELASYRLSWENEKNLLDELDSLLVMNKGKEREIELCRFELNELQEADLKEGEEERLFEAYKRFSSSRELSQKLETLKASLSESPQAAIPLLNRLKSMAQALQEMDSRLKEPVQLLHDGILSLNEAARLLNSFSYDEDADADQLSFIDNRLSNIHHLKRKYGKTITEILLFQEELKTKLSHLEQLEEKLAELNGKLVVVQEELNQLSSLLTLKRQKAADHLQKTLTQILHSLNMAKASFLIEIKQTERSSSGHDLIEFWLKPNIGEEAVLVRENSSGGELCRILLALNVALAEKNLTPTIIFDEIDANVGGETATLMAEKLKKLGSHRQILCITHFPQVARQADHHLHVFKEESEGRTLGFVKSLNSKEKEKELLRMLGGQKIHIE